MGVYSIQSDNKILSIALSLLLFMGIYVIAFPIEQYSNVKAQKQSNNTTTSPSSPSSPSPSITPMNATQLNAASANV